jgi:DNA helicase-2/ATP-dependent DNA helicase PcrA
MAGKVPLEQLWQAHGFTPNQAQERAIRHIDGPLYLPAGPGSGKTRVLLWRTLNLIVNEGVKPEEIFLATFTEKAARQLKDGLTELLLFVQQYTNHTFDINAMYVGTIHSLCQRLLQKKNSRSTAHPFALMTELDQYFFVRQHWDTLISEGFGIQVESALVDTSPQHVAISSKIGQTQYKNSESEYIAIMSAISFFNRCAEENLHPSGTKISTDDETIQSLLRMYTKYNQLLDSAYLVDFSTIQRRAYEYVVQDQRIQKQFSHVIVDEYQDTNPVQENLLFALARHSRNICVVGDDDQALYRFRGATVENFVQFSRRVKEHIKATPTEIMLDTNYRSHPTIVHGYNAYMQNGNWYVEGGSARVGMEIKPYRSVDNTQPYPALCVTDKGNTLAPQQIAQLIKELKDQNKVADYNQIAILFPSLKGDNGPSSKVQAVIDELDALGIKTYAPRAGRFLDLPEAKDIFGVLMHILGKPEFNDDISGRDYDNYRDWCKGVFVRGEHIIQADWRLRRFVQSLQTAHATRSNDRELMVQTLRRLNLDLDAIYNPDAPASLNIKHLLLNSGISEKSISALGGSYADAHARQLFNEGKPLVARRLIARATTFDYTVLDLFYQLLGFEHFKQMVDIAQSGEDEGPITNLALISRHLSNFLNTRRIPMLSARDFSDGVIQKTFWHLFIYVLFRRGESEYEDEEMLFPRGRVPILTVHQSKGLEFPVVILGNSAKQDRLQPLEQVMRSINVRNFYEPIDRSPTFDSMRLFYVALSRAKHLCVIAYHSNHMHDSLKPFLQQTNQYVAKLRDLTVASVPADLEDATVAPKQYSYTADFQSYSNCPRQYMFFRKYRFAPSQTRAQMFGSLVHRTIDAIHQRLIDAE